LEIIRFLFEDSIYLPESSRLFSPVLNHTVRDTSGNNGLLIAANGGHLEVVRFFFEEGNQQKYGFNTEYFTSTNKGGDNVMHKAACSGKANVLKFLLEESEKGFLSSEIIFARNKDKRNPQDYALDYNKVEVLKVFEEMEYDQKLYEFLERKHEMNEMDTSDFQTAIFNQWISCAKNGRLEPFKWLIQVTPFLRSQVNQVAYPDSKDNYNVFHYCCYQGKKGNLEIIRFLLQDSIYLPDSTRNEHDEKSLFIATKQGRLDVLRFFFEEEIAQKFGFNSGYLKSTDKLGNTALLTAASKHGKLPILQFLFSQPKSLVDPRAKNNQGLNCVMIAASENKVEILKWLLENASEEIIFAKNNMKQNPLDIAKATNKYNNLDEIIKVFEEWKYELKEVAPSLSEVDPRKWTSKQVGAWCEVEMKLPTSICKTLRENEINGRALMRLNDTELKDDLKVSSSKLRKDLLEKIYELAQKNGIKGVKLPSSTANLIEADSIELTCVLGRGAFGEVWRGIWNKGTPVAVKKLLSDNAAASEDFLKELEIMESLKAPNVVQTFGYFQDKENKLNLVMEFLDGGALDKFLQEAKANSKSPSLESKLKLCHEITAGVLYLHSRNILHRDLAARNVLVSEDLKLIKVSDFGLATSVSSSYYSGSKDKPLPVKWCALEVIANRRYSRSSDIWSMSVIFWEIFSGGETPYATMNNTEAFEFVKQGNRLEKPCSDCPEELYKLMLDCWNEDYEKRPNAEKVRECLGNMLNKNLVDEISNNGNENQKENDNDSNYAEFIN